MTDERDRFAEEEAEAAAAEARNIGGRPTRDLEEDLPHNPAMDPVYEGGGGEAEGKEIAVQPPAEEVAAPAPDLMSALKASLDAVRAADGEPDGAAKRRKPAAKKGPAKKPAAKKAAAKPRATAKR